MFSSSRTTKVEATLCTDALQKAEALCRRDCAEWRQEGKAGIPEDPSHEDVLSWALAVAINPKLQAAYHSTAVHVDE